MFDALGSREAVQVVQDDAQGPACRDCRFPDAPSTLRRNYETESGEKRNVWELGVGPSLWWASALADRAGQQPRLANSNEDDQVPI
jgi:hypothetical protein